MASPATLLSSSLPGPLATPASGSSLLQPAEPGQDFASAMQREMRAADAEPRSPAASVKAPAVAAAQPTADSVVVPQASAASRPRKAAEPAEGKTAAADGLEAAGAATSEPQAMAPSGAATLKRWRPGATSQRPGVQVSAGARISGQPTSMADLQDAIAGKAAGQRDRNTLKTSAGQSGADADPLGPLPTPDAGSLAWAPVAQALAEPPSPTSTAASNATPGSTAGVPDAGLTAKARAPAALGLDANDAATPALTAILPAGAAAEDMAPTTASKARPEVANEAEPPRRRPGDLGGDGHATAAATAAPLANAGAFLTTAGAAPDGANAVAAPGGAMAAIAIAVAPRPATAAAPAGVPAVAATAAATSPGLLAAMAPAREAASAGAAGAWPRFEATGGVRRSATKADSASEENRAALGSKTELAEHGAAGANPLVANIAAPAKPAGGPDLSVSRPEDSSMGSAAAASATAAQAGPAALSTSSGATAVGFGRIDWPIDQPGFGPALGAQVSLMVRDGLQQATLQLNPAEMGPIMVQIAIDGSAARVNFQAEVAATRSAIEASLPALAGALQEAGLTLSGGSVGQPVMASEPAAGTTTGSQAQGQPSGQTAGQHTGQRQAEGRNEALIGQPALVGPEDSATLAIQRTTPGGTRRGLVDLVA